MTGKKYAVLSSSAAAALALAVFTGAAFAGNGNGNGNQPSAPGNSAAAPGQMKQATPVTAAPTQQQQAPATKPSKAAKPAHTNASSHSSGSTTAAGVKPSSSTAKNPNHWTTVGANPNVSKRYGNGQTAAGIAASRGASADTKLYGPGNSQPHKVSVCGKANGHYVDVHAVKSYTNAACTTQTQQPSAQVTQTKTCGSVTTTSTTTKLQRGHAYGLLKHGKALHSKTVTTTVTLPTGEVCTVSGPTQESVQQQVVQVLTQALGTAPTQQQVAQATEATQAKSHESKSGVLAASVTKKGSLQAAGKSGRGGVLGAFATVGRQTAHGTLPFTGFPIWAALLIGAALIAVGIALTRRRGVRDVV